MEPDERARSFLATARPRLEAAGFEILNDVHHDGRLFDMVAVRKRVEATKFGSSHSFFVFSTLPSIDPVALEEFSTACFKYVDEVHRSGMPRGAGKVVVCFPVAMVPTVDAATSDAVSKRPAGKHWGGMEMPVVVDLGVGKLHYLEKTPMWGAAYYRGFRKMIKELLGGG